MLKAVDCSLFEFHDHLVWMSVRTKCFNLLSHPHVGSLKFCWVTRRTSLVTGDHSVEGQVLSEGMYHIDLEEKFWSSFEGPIRSQYWDDSSISRLRCVPNMRILSGQEPESWKGSSPP